MQKPTTRSVGAALTLFVLTPLIAEYLLGSLSIAQIGALPVLCLLYGSGTVLIREAARTKNRGWPAVVILGTAYAIVEEGIATQSLFNPHYLHLTLLDYGYMPSLGMGAPWTVYVIGLHVIWSVCVPIAIVEALFPARAEQPWLKITGRVVFGFLLLLGVVAVANYTHKTEQFMASTLQLSVSAMAALALIVWGLRVHGASPSSETTTKRAPAVWVAGAFALVVGGAFEIAQSLQTHQFPWVLTVSVRLVLVAIGLTAILIWSNRAGWSAAHRFALGAAGLLVYCVWGYGVEISLHGRSGLIAHSILVALALIMIVATTVRMRWAFSRE